MSQWREDYNGKYKRVHKRHCRRRACIVYYYKTLWNYEYGFLGADVYTAKPKGESLYRVSYQVAGGVRSEIARVISAAHEQEEQA